MRALLTVVVALVLAGCGSGGTSDAPSPSPSSVPTSPTPSSPDTPEPDESADTSPAPPCDTLSDRQATRIAGTPQEVRGPERAGDIDRCYTVVQVFDPLGLTWAFAESAPLERLAEAENRDNLLDITDIQLQGARPARLLTGTVDGTAFTQVVTLLDDDRAVVVEARDTGLGQTRSSSADLSDVAIRVAEAIAR